jgi:serine/threonine protein kinase
VESLAGKTLGQYRLERLLANGSQTATYQARDQRLERLVAVKVSVLPGAAGRFRAEVRLTGSLDHPNILPIYDFGEEAGIAYLVRHYAAGGSLEDRLRAANGKNALPLEEIAFYLDQAAAALDYTHTRGLVHGNLKPANLLLRERWLMLGDFGTAQREGNASQAHPAAGVSAYSAPEQRGSAPVGPPADMYALGVTFYRLLWGVIPGADAAGRRAGNALHAATPLAVVAARPAQALEALLRQALSAKPEDRPQTAGALAAEVRAIIAVSGEQNVPAEVPLICPSCGFLNKPQARFCRNDGTRLPIICPRCGAENRSDAKFCQSDGTELVRICPTCGAVNPRQARVCQNDQAPLARICPICGFENALRARFCERDGAALAAGR